jgi:hypothetical protein
MTIIPEVRLWEQELPESWHTIRPGDKIVPKRGAFKDVPLKVVSKLHQAGYKFVYCDKVKT